VFSEDDGVQAVRLARAIIDAHVHGRSPAGLEFPESFSAKGGVFTTISKHPGHELRGCIGIPEPVMSLREAIVQSAMSAATEDPRFAPVVPAELDRIVVEVTLLSRPEPVPVSRPKELLERVKVGVHGLIASRGPYRGLLLPQVPVEQGWDVEEFLKHTCWKAGLAPEAWKDPQTKFMWFTGQVFAEQGPRGPVAPKPLTASCSE
jgi:uncharacterized protein (TIGR00296 family)